MLVYTSHQPAGASCGTLRRTRGRPRSVAACSSLSALLWDCDGVILESEALHLRAYNATFAHFAVQCSGAPLVWSESYYDKLSNTVGGGKPKMRWCFNNTTGWPEGCDNESARDTLIDTLQDWKTEHYENLIKSGAVEPRPGVLSLMDEARAAGLKVAVCSAATKTAAVTTVSSLLGPARWNALDCFLAGSDVPKLKPDPLIYLTACERLGVQPAECIVIEDSTVGLKAATAAGMRCVITYTSTGKSEPFDEALCVVDNLVSGGVTLDTLRRLHAGAPRVDDRLAKA